MGKASATTEQPSPPPGRDGLQNSVGLTPAPAQPAHGQSSGMGFELDYGRASGKHGPTRAVRRCRLPPKVVMPHIMWRRGPVGDALSRGSSLAAGDCQSG